MSLRLVRTIFFQLISLLYGLNDSYGQPISQVQKFYRCHAHLVDKRPLRNDSLLLEVKSGSKTAQQACLELLNMANLNSSGVLANANDSTARAILSNMQKLHASWLDGKNLSSIFNNGSWVAEVHDYNAASMYLTRALFDESYDFKKIVTDDEGLDVLRDINAPGGSQNANEKIEGTNKFYIDEVNGQTLAQVAAAPWIHRDGSYSANFQSTIIDKGPLLGWKTARNESVLTPDFGVIHFHQNQLGAGAFTHQTYLLGNSQHIGRSDGGLRTHRRLTSRIINNFLCRDLPVLKSSDVQQYVDPSSPLAFRRASSCMVCHKTMDDFGHMFRGLRQTTIGHFSSNGEMPSFVSTFLSSISRSGESPIGAGTPENSFHERPPRGSFVYKDMDGNLINQDFDSVDNFGEFLGDFDDLYACFAGRYLEYFTGVKPYLGDINDMQLSPVEMEHRELAKSLGQKLKQTQNPKAVIEQIMNSSIYNDLNYERTK